MTRRDIEITLPRMEEQLRNLQEDGEWVDKMIPNADYIKIGLLLKILESLNHIETYMRVPK